MNKEGSFAPIIILMCISLLIAFFWDKLEFIKNSVDFILNPSAGVLLNWNISFGMTIIVALKLIFQKNKKD